MQEKEQQLGSLQRQELHVRTLNIFVTWQTLMQNTLGVLHTKLLKIKKYITLEKKLITYSKEIDPYETLHEYGDGIMEKNDRGWTMESYRNYMIRRDAEEQMIKASDDDREIMKY